MSVSRSVIGILEAVLRVEGVDTAEDYYDLGGTSLQAMRICLQIKKELDLDVAPEALFDSQSIGEFAEQVRQLHEQRPAVDAP